MFFASDLDGFAGLFPEVDDLAGEAGGLPDDGDMFEAAGADVAAGGALGDAAGVGNQCDEVRIALAEHGDATVDELRATDGISGGTNDAAFEVLGKGFEDGRAHGEGVRGDDGLFGVGKAGW